MGALIGLVAVLTSARLGSAQPVVGANFCRNRAAVTEPAWAQAELSFLTSAISVSSAAT